MGTLTKNKKIAIGVILAIFVLTSLRGFLLILIPVGGAIYLRNPENRKNFFAALGRFREVFVQNFRTLIGKDNRTALAIAIGAIAIVLAIVFSNNQTQNAGNQNNQEYQLKLETYRTCIRNELYQEIVADHMCKKYAGLD